MSVRFGATATGRSLGDHVCWPFHGTDDLVSAAHGYVTEGLDRNERVSYCTIDSSGMYQAVISEVGEVGRLAGDGGPVLTGTAPASHWPPWTSPVHAFGQLMQAAVDDGYAGLRVLTDATEVVRDEATRPWWVRGEHQIDRYGLDHPLTVLCGYDVELVGEELLGDVACLHALTAGMPSPFLLRAADVGGGLALVGEVDRASAVRLYHAMMGIAADLAHPVALDLSEHEFIDHSALVALDRAARDLGTRIDLVGASPLTASLVEVLELTGVTALEEP